MSHEGMGRRQFLGMTSMLMGLGVFNACQRMVHAEMKTDSPRRLATFACDVTPPMGTPVYSGYTPMSFRETPLMAKGVVLEDSGKRYVLCAVDYCELRNSTHLIWRTKIAEAAGTEVSRVAVQCVHQHTAPMADGDAVRILVKDGDPSSQASAESFEEPAYRVADSVKFALGYLTPFDRIGTSQARVERVASNRRVPIGDGKVGFRASSCKDPKLIEMPEGLIDPFLKTITFAQGDKPLVRLHYYATHPQTFYGDPRVSYDFVGMAREKMQFEEHVPQIYFNGCGGNVACGKYNDASVRAREGLFERMYAAMQASAAGAQYAPAREIIWRNAPFAMIPREDGEYSDDTARATMKDGSKAPHIRLGGAMTLACKARAKTPIDLTSWEMGDIKAIHLPGEPAVEFQLYAQELCPDKFVCTAGYGDGAPGYVCLERFFEEGGYEPTASTVIPQSEKPFRDAIRNLLGV